jgi:hypothetical protein
MKRALAILAPWLLLLGGCLSAPLAQDLIPVRQSTPPEPLRIQEIVRLSNAGISEETIIGLIKARGILDRPNLQGTLKLKDEGVGDAVILVLLGSTPAERPKPRPRIVYRELFIPLWPSYSGGRWHLGLRMACTWRVSPEGELPEPVEPEVVEPLPQVVDP